MQLKKYNMFDFNNLIDICYTTSKKSEKESKSDSTSESSFTKKSIARAKILQDRSSSAYSYFKKSIDKYSETDLDFLDLEMMVGSNLE